MSLGLEPVEERREEQRVAEARISPATGRPGGKSPPITARLRNDRSTNGTVTLLVGVED